MEELYEKYAKVLLERGVNLQKNQPLLITAPIESYEFIRVLTETACKMGSRDIYFDFEDDYLKKSELEYFDVDDLKNQNFFNKKIYDEYAKKDAAFLMLLSDCSELMKAVSHEKLDATAKISRTSRLIYKEKQNNSEIPWCIASVATKVWANRLFKNSEEPMKKLWTKIFECALIDKKNPISEWDEKISKLEQKCKILNNLKLKKLHYKNSLGTDLEIGLNSNHIWSSGQDKLPDDRVYIANIPTEEVFTSPDKSLTNGVVVSSKPLVYNGGVIDDIKLVFKDGKVIEAYSKSNQKLLDSIINSHDNMNYLGEVALVDYDSPISNTGLIFYETLFDENAACHLALGNGFATCLKDGIKLDDYEQEKLGLNLSKGHVDFMIGNNDLTIIGTTADDRKVTIFENGNFNEKLKETM